MSVFERLQSIDRRVIYVVFFLITAYPMIRPIATPLALSPMTLAIFDTVEQLQPGDVVVLSAEYSAAMVGELSPPLVAVMNHLLTKPGIKVVGIAFDPEGMMFIAQMVEMAISAGWVYGERIVNLGYAPGGEGTITAFAEDIHKTYPVEYMGARVGDVPMMRDIRSADDVALVIQFSGGGLGPLGWIRQVHIPYGTPIATILSLVMLPSSVPYYQAGQLAGLGGGLRAGAEYELMVGKLGRATASMTAQSFLHVYTLALIVLANIGYFGLRARRRGETRSEQ